jgi:hypothetical protein
MVTGDRLFDDLPHISCFVRQKDNVTSKGVAWHQVKMTS